MCDPNLCVALYFVRQSLLPAWGLWLCFSRCWLCCRAAACSSPGTAGRSLAAPPKFLPPPSRCQRGWVSGQALPGIPAARSSIPPCWLPAVSHTRLPSPTSPRGLEALLVLKIPHGG